MGISGSRLAPIWCLALALSVLIFFIDLQLPLGVAGAVPYVAVILVAWWLPNRRDVIALATITSILTVTGYIYSPPGGTPWIVITNRSLALFAIWSVAILIIQRKPTEEILRESRDKLEIEVSERTKELREAEALSKDRTNLLEAVFDSITQGLVAFDKDLKLISWNDKFLEIRGYPKEMVEMGRPFSDFMQYDIEHDEFELNDDELNLQQLIMQAGKFEYHDFERQRPNGTFIEVRGGPIPGGGFVSTFSDVTKRRKAEDEAIKMSLVIEQSPVSIVITDLKGTIEYVNPRFMETSGYSIEEVIGQNPRIVKSGNNDPKIYEDMWKTLIDGRNWQGELINKNKGGEEYWEAVSISPVFSKEGDITHFVGVKEDITDQKKRGEELEKTYRQSEAFNKMAIDRELKMIELKKEIDQLLEKMGEAPRYSDTS
jgi:PAS domain S-box-containing protein